MPKINGREYQHAIVDVRIGPQGGSSITITTFKKISYKDTVEKKATNNAKGKVDGFTFDNEKIEGSITMRLKEWFLIKDFLLQNAGPNIGIGQIVCEIPVSYGDDPNDLRTDNLTGVMFNEEARDSEDSQDPLTIEIPLFIMEIKDSKNKHFVEY